MSVVLITGAYGFVGTNLSAFLAGRGFAVWALDVPQAGGSGPTAYARRFGWEQLGEIPWPEVDAVVHLAGKAHDTRNASDAASYFEINAGLTRKIAQSAAGGWRAAGAGGHRRTFVLFSSVKAAADRAEDVLTEDAVPNPQTPYGKSKLEAEKEVLKCGSSNVREAATANDANSSNGGDSRTHELTNFRTYILRPCMIHGPGNKGNLNLLYKVVRLGVPWPLGAFENRRSFASVENVCAVVAGLLTQDVPAGIYQVADDEALSTNEVIREIAAALGRRPRIWSLPAGAVRWLARAGDRLHLPLNSERLKKLTESYVVSNAKVKRALGWAAMPADARAGMRRTLENFSRQGQ